MEKSIKTLFNELCPPLLKKSINASLGRNLAWIGDFETWEEARKQSTGYDVHTYIEELIQKVKIVRSDEGKSERDNVLFDFITYPYPLLANLFALLTHLGSKNVFFLDYGGSLGSLYFTNRKFLRVLESFTWNILDQEIVIQAGREHFQTTELLFHSSIDEAKSHIRPQDRKILILSGVLHYLEDPFGTLEELLKTIDFDGILVDRTPFSQCGRDQIKVQKVPSQIYRASYPCRLFSKTQFLEFFQRIATRGGGYKLLDTFDSYIDTHQKDMLFLGFCFARRNHA